MSLFLGVDAGGTRTTFVLADATEVLARTTAGSIKRMRVSAEVADRHLDEALAELRRQVDFETADIARTCVGIAGESVPLVRDWVAAAFGARVGGELLVAGDVDIALDAAFGSGRGVLVLAGTGSNVLGRAADGTACNVGGWGPVLGDQGSGYWIGRQALFAAFCAVNEGLPSPFLDAVKAAWGVASLDDVVATAHAVPAPDFAALSTVVSSLAAAGDAACGAVLLRGGWELAAQAAAAVRQIRALENGDADWMPPAIACAGSVLEHVAAVREAMTLRLQETFASIEVLPGAVDPVMGAVWRARSR